MSVLLQRGSVPGGGGDAQLKLYQGRQKQKS